jgi:hypothetical protein
MITVGCGNESFFFANTLQVVLAHEVQYTLMIGPDAPPIQFLDDEAVDVAQTIQSNLLDVLARSFIGFGRLELLDQEADFHRLLTDQTLQLGDFGFLSMGVGLHCISLIPIEASFK